MSTRNRGKRLAGSITGAVALGSLATAGVGAATIYSSTPSVVSKAASTTSTTAPGGSKAPGASTAPGGSAIQGASPYGSTQDNSARRPRGATGVSPVQPGNGGVIHGQSSGS